MRAAWWTSRSNCLVYALKRWFSKSGYLVIRKSNFGWWPHFLWTPDISGTYIEHYAPIMGERKLMPPPLFKGAVRMSDKISEKAAVPDGYAKVEGLLFLLFCLIVGGFSLIGALLAVLVIVPAYKVVQFLAAKVGKKNPIVESSPSAQQQPQASPLEEILAMSQLAPELNPLISMPTSALPELVPCSSLVMPQTWNSKPERSHRISPSSVSRNIVDEAYYRRETKKAVLH